MPTNPAAGDPVQLDPNNVGEPVVAFNLFNSADGDRVLFVFYRDHERTDAICYANMSADEAQVMARNILAGRDVRNDA